MLTKIFTRFAVLLILFIILFFIMDGLFGRQNGSSFQNEYAGSSNELTNKLDLNYLQNFPLRFEQNLGQGFAESKYFTKGKNFSLSFCSNKIILRPRINFNIYNRQNSQVNIKFNNSNTHTKISGISPLNTSINYFLGNNKNNWITDVPNFEKVKYEELYNGINLIFYGKQNELEYDFVIEPYANPGQISFSVENADNLFINTNGNITIRKDEHDIKMNAPKIYQIIGNKIINVDGNFILDEVNNLRFDLGKYDKSFPLIIDPIIIFSTYFGGGNSDFAYDIALDNGNNIYLIGETISSDFPIKNAVQPTRGGGWGDIFISKINSAGTEIIFSTFLGGSNSDIGNGITLDQNGNIYLIGNTSSTDFPIKNALQSTLGSSNWGDAFITILNNSGSEILFSSYLGGSGSEMGNSIAVGNDNSFVITGLTTSTNFPLVNAFQNNLSGGIFPQDIFITKFAPLATGLVYSTYLGNSSILSELGKDVVIDSKNNAIIIGSTGAVDFPLVNPLQNKIGGSYDVFVTKFSPLGVPVFSTFLGGTQIDQGEGIAVDKNDDIYITGHTNSADFPTKNPIQNKGGIFDNDIFISKISSDGQSLIYSTYLAGTDGDAGNDIAVNDKSEAYVTGSTSSDDFNTVNSLQDYNAGIFPPYRTDIFVAKLNASGDKFIYSTYIGGNQDDEGNGIKVDKNSNAVITGKTKSNNDFPVKNPLQDYFGGGTCDQFPCPDGFIIKLNEQVLDSPENLKYEISGTDVTLRWEAADPQNLSAYNIYRSNTSPVFCSQLNKIGSCPVSQTSFQDKIISTGSKYYYVVTASYLDGESSPSNEVTISFTSLTEDQNNIPKEFLLLQNFPNPFNPTTTVEYVLPTECEVSLFIYNQSGKKINEIHAGLKSIGYHKINIILNEQASGVYFYQLSAKSLNANTIFRETKKLLLLK